MRKYASLILAVVVVVAFSVNVAVPQEQPSDVDKQIATLQSRLDELEAKLNKINERSYNLRLGSWSSEDKSLERVEKILQDKGRELDSEYLELRKQMYELKTPMRVEQHNKAFAAMDLSFLSEKHENGTPKYAVLGIWENLCQVGIVPEETLKNSKFGLDRTLKAINNDSKTNKLLSFYQAPEGKAYITTFPCMVPKDVKERVDAVSQEHKFFYVALLFETKQESWSEPSEPLALALPFSNPFVPDEVKVIGIELVDSKPMCWLIDKFKPVTAEQYIAEELGVK